MAKLLRMLEKMKLVNRSTAPGTPAPPGPVATSSSTLGDAVEDDGIDPGLPPVEVEEIPQKRFQEALEDDAGDQEALEDFPFERIYASAGIVEPDHGFTVYTLMEMLSAEELSELDQETTARVIGGMLKRLPSHSIDIEEIVGDAARRDHALDAFERFLRDRLARSDEEVTEANRILQDEVDEITRRNTELMKANRARLEGELHRFDTWLVRKQAEEQRLFNAVAPFVQSNPVTGPDEEDPPG